MQVILNVQINLYHQSERYILGTWKSRPSGKYRAVLIGKQKILLFMQEGIYAISENMQTRKSQK